MEQEPNEGEEKMNSWYELFEDNRQDFPELERVWLGPLSSRYFGDTTFEILPPRGGVSAVLASYVISRDGVFSVGGHGPEVVSQGNVADARVLALVTALSGESVATGSGTLYEEGGNRWGIDGLVSKILAGDPAFLDEMRVLARERRHSRKPTTFVMTRSGEFPAGTDFGVFADEKYDAFIVTTARGEGKAKDALGSADRVLVFGDEDIDHRAFLSYASASGINHLALQGGKRMAAPFAQKRLMSQLLLSVMESSVKEEVTGERVMLFPNGASVPSRKARLITARSAEEITLRNYDMREVEEF